MDELPGATEDQLGWKLVEEISVRAAKLLEPVFDVHHGRQGRLSIQIDPRTYRDSAAMVENAVAFSRLAPNMIVKIPATQRGHHRDRGGGLPRGDHQRHRLLHAAPVHRRRREPWSVVSTAARPRARTSARWAHSARSWWAASTTGSRW